jgi:hypothetical protein
VNTELYFSTFGVPTIVVTLRAKHPNDLLVPVYSAQDLGKRCPRQIVSTINTHGGILSEAKGRKVLEDLKLAFPVR